MNIIMKFGGTSVADGKRIRISAGLMNKHLQGNKITVVVSAMDGVTDQLLDVAVNAKKCLINKVKDSLQEMEKKHRDAVKEAIRRPEGKRQILSLISSLFEELQKILTSVYILKELTPRVKDQILSFGERLSSAIFKATLADIGVRAEYLIGGDAGIVTDDNFGEASPLVDVSRMKIQSRLAPLLEKGIVPVVTGFVGMSQNGDPTTLGRGGSDYTATILAVSLHADEVWLWSDVDGIMTADPKIVKNAKLIPILSYDEASEMSIFGAKAMHPRALEPAAEHGIVVRVRNTFNPDSPGTLITSKSGVESRDLVKAVALIQNVGMINITGGGMVGRAGTSGKIFDVLGKNNINILMISQSISEASITLIVGRNTLQRAVTALEIAMLGKGLIRDITFEDDVSVIAVVGAGMRGTLGVAAKIFRAVAGIRVNVRMIAQGSSELSISFVVKEKDCLKAVKAIHKDFALGE